MAPPLASRAGCAPLWSSRSGAGPVPSSCPGTRPAQGPGVTDQILALKRSSLALRPGPDVKV